MQVMQIELTIMPVRIWCRNIKAIVIGTVHLLTVDTEVIDIFWEYKNLKCSLHFII